MTITMNIKIVALICAMVHAVSLDAFPSLSTLWRKAPATETVQKIVESSAKEIAPVVQKSRLMDYAYKGAQAVVKTAANTAFATSELALKTASNYPRTSLLLAAGGLAYYKRNEIKKLYEEYKPQLKVAAVALGAVAAGIAAKKMFDAYYALPEIAASASHAVVATNNMKQFTQDLSSLVSSGVQKDIASQECDYAHIWNEIEMQNSIAKEVSPAVSVVNSSLIPAPVVQQSVSDLTGHETKVFEGAWNSYKNELVSKSPSAGSITELPITQPTVQLVDQFMYPERELALSLLDSDKEASKIGAKWAAEFNEVESNVDDADVPDTETDSVSSDNNDDAGDELYIIPGYEDSPNKIATPLHNPWLERAQRLLGHILPTRYIPARCE